MSILKRIGVGLGIVAIAAMFLTNPVIAKSNDHPNTTYVNANNYLPRDEEIKRLKDCSISNFDNKGGNSVFSDPSSKADIEYAYKSGYKIIDLGKMAEKMNRGLLVKIGDAASGKDEVLNNGVMIIRDYGDERFERHICKCNESEFKAFFDGFKYIDWEDHGNNTYTYNIPEPYGRIVGRYSITYDRAKEIMNFTVLYY